MVTEYPVPSHSDSYGITTGPDHLLWFTELPANTIGKLRPSAANPRLAVPT
jgi:streptogramin lyase